jgi:hypothetical protein
LKLERKKKNSTEAANSREPPSLVLERERERERNFEGSEGRGGFILGGFGGKERD